MARLGFAPEVIADVHDILTTLTEKAGDEVAATYFDRFEATFDRIAMFPLSGGPRPKWGRTVRIAVVSPYVVIYRTIADDVEIMRLLHGHRRITRRMLRGQN